MGTMPYLAHHLLGSFLVDDKLQIILQGSEQKLKKKYPEAKELPPEKFPVFLQQISQPYFQELYEKNLALTREALRHSVQEDQLIIQTIANIQELDKVHNLLTKRLREWYSWYFPELSQQISDHLKFAEQVEQGEQKPQDSMGAELAKIHIQEMQLLAQEISRLHALRKQHEHYLEDVMRTYCPNLLALAGVTIAAKLLEIAKSLKHLALLPSSTLQILGAEKALFRHIKTGSKSPKYGVLFQHPLIQKAKRENRGKMARMLADKLSLCARLDFFQGGFKADAYQKELEEKSKEPRHETT